MDRRVWFIRDRNTGVLKSSKSSNRKSPTLYNSYSQAKGCATQARLDPRDYELVEFELQEVGRCPIN